MQENKRLFLWVMVEIQENLSGGLYFREGIGTGKLGELKGRRISK